MTDIYKRWQHQVIVAAMKTRRVLVLAGARQCGKTTLAKTFVDIESIYRNLDDVTLLDAAQHDPQGFVKHDDELMIIDEVQRVPILLQAIKQDVDENQQAGRFLLTGSTNLQSLPGVTESLAGRIRKVRLRPLAMGEIHGTTPDFIKQVFQRKLNTLETKLGQANYDKAAYILLALRGGYPEALRLQDEKEVRKWYQDYIAALIERDLRDIINIRRKDNMDKLLEVLSAWSSKFMDISKIGRGLSIVRPVVESYINALASLYLVERVRPWTNTDYARVGKQDKLFMTDTGLMSAILNWRFDRVHLDGDISGKLLETFVFTQLTAMLEAHDGMFQLYHYRDRDKREIDFIVENEAGNMAGFEVKAGTVVTKESFKHLQWFKDNMAKECDFIGIVLYTGASLVSFGEGLWAVPMSALWV